MMRKALVVTIAVPLTIVGAASQADPDPGKSAFIDGGCARCHSVETQSIEATITSERLRGRDLSRIGSEREADWLVAYLKREETVEGRRHRSPYSGTEKDLQVLTEWLATLP